MGKRPPEAPDDEYKPTPILGWLYRRFFAHIKVDDRWNEVVTSAAERGVVVYVMRSISMLDFVCLDFLVKTLGLPLLRFVNDLGWGVLEPFGKGERRLRRRRLIPEEEALAKVLREHFSALLFLRRPPNFGQSTERGEDLEVDLIRTLIETQRQMEEPILLVPQTFVWTQLPAKRKRSVWDLIFGPTEWPGTIRRFFQFLLNYKNARLRSGDPFDLKAFIQTRQDSTDREVADQVRYALLRIIERERVLVVGPRKKTPGRIREELLRSPRVRKRIEAEARTSKKTVEKVTRSAEKTLRRLCAAPNMQVTLLLKRLLDWVWNRIFSGMVVDLEGIERVRDKAREGALILLPSHKSHVDYLVLSDILHRNALNIPLIAAGENLSFFPAGPILRRAGAFFIRRSFRGSKLYPALVDAYLRKLIVEGFSIEFFLEGGRSRTGKLLNPKFGLLSMIVDAALLLPNRKVHFVPISIGYERIIEERAYVQEAEGGEKTRENLGGLLKTPKVLSSRYGRVYVEFGEILSFDQILEEFADVGENGKLDRNLSPSKRRAMIQRTAFRAIHEINMATAVTPSALFATAILSHERRGMTRATLVQTARSLVTVLESMGARFAPSLLAEEGGGLREDTLEVTLSLFESGKLIARHGEGLEAIYSVPEERRLALSYYKNSIIHFFVPRALISAALLAEPGPTVSLTELRETVRRVSQVFKHEFIYRAGAKFDDLFDEAVASMLGLGEVTLEDGRLSPATDRTDSPVVAYANMIGPFLDAYRLAEKGLSLLEKKPMTAKDWAKKTLVLGHRMFLTGELQYREALSKHTLVNAVLALRDSRRVKSGPGDTIALPPSTPEVDDWGFGKLRQNAAASEAR